MNSATGWYPVERGHVAGGVDRPHRDLHQHAHRKAGAPQETGQRDLDRHRGLEQRLGDGTIRADVAYSETSQTYPRRDELLFRSTLRPTLSYNFADADLPSYSLFTSKEYLQTGTFAFRENAFRSNTTKNDELTVAIRTDLPIAEYVTLSTGGKYRERHISADEERFRDRRASAAPSQTLAGLLSDQESRNFDYDLGKRFDTGLADAYFDAAKATSERRLPQSLTADYTAEESILGLFGMTKIRQRRHDIGRGPARRDHQLPVERAERVADGGDRHRQWQGGYVDFFPNLTLRQAFTPNLILRAALSRAINRANFRSSRRACSRRPRAIRSALSPAIRASTRRWRTTSMRAWNITSGRWA